MNVKKLLIICLLVQLSTISLATENAASFQNLKINEDISKVSNFFSTYCLIKITSMCTSETRIADIEAILMIEVHNSKIRRISVLFDEIHYNNIFNGLSEKYGVPEKTNNYKSNFSERYSRRAEWEIKKNTVKKSDSIVLTNENSGYLYCLAQKTAGNADTKQKEMCTLIEAKSGSIDYSSNEIEQEIDKNEAKNYSNSL